MTAAVDKLLGARLPGPPAGLRRGPLRRGAFSSPLHTERRAARVGVWLGIAFTVSFLTGLISHLIQQPPSWFFWPASPVWLYRFTQGLHVSLGIATVPLLLVKLWTVYPKLFAWPPAGTPAKLVGRVSILVLVGAATMQLATGLVNLSKWYPFGFNFTVAHFWTAWIAIGAVFVHVGSYAPAIARGLARRGSPAATAGLPPAEARELVDDEAAARDAAVSRRTLLVAAGLGVGAAAVLNAGQTLTPLGRISVLAPRIPGYGPQGLPVNKTAGGAGVTDSARDPSWRLVVEGPNRLELDRAALQAMEQHTERLPIACVEGWSTNADWTGVRLVDLLAAAGHPAGTQVRVESLQQGGLYRYSVVAPPHSRSEQTLIALQLNGQELDLDHGYPARLIAPNRPGVMQTKWITMITPTSSDDSDAPS